MASKGAESRSWRPPIHSTSINGEWNQEGAPSILAAQHPFSHGTVILHRPHVPTRPRVFQEVIQRFQGIDEVTIVVHNVVSYGPKVLNTLFYGMLDPRVIFFACDTAEPLQPFNNTRFIAIDVDDAQMG